MTFSTPQDDEQAIRTPIGAHFEGMKRTRETQPDWESFSACFLPGALLYPPARPVQAKTVEAFVQRMNTVAADVLHTFEEHTLPGLKILRFGNVAVVLAASEMLENETETNHDVSAYLLVKSEGKWQIAAHALDKVSEDQPLPGELRCHDALIRPSGILPSSSSDLTGGRRKCLPQDQRDNPAGELPCTLGRMRPYEGHWRADDRDRRALLTLWLDDFLHGLSTFPDI